MSSKSFFEKTEIKKEALQYWNDNYSITQEGENIKFFTKKENTNSYKLEFSKRAKAIIEENNSKKIEESKKNNDGIKIDELSKIKLTIMRTLLEAFSGKKINSLVLDEDCNMEDNTNEKICELKKDESNENAVRRGWGLIYKYSTETSEKEFTGFNSNGIVKTADGREIRFNLNFNLKREKISSESYEIKDGDALVDPLVISYNGTIPVLGDEKLEFDIDADGIKDFINFTGKGSGFLVLDKNENGTIDNGNELFGPNSNDGFLELAQYDSDKNGWIDENDSIFSKLKIWTKDESGEKVLLGIAEVGVGAIYLGNSTTSFTLKDSNERTTGMMQKSGFFLKENGVAGIISHIDLKK